MSYKGLPQDDLSFHSSTTPQDHQDNQMRRRAVSYSGAEPARSMDSHMWFSAGAGFINTRPQSLGQVWGAPFNQTTPILGSDDHQVNAEMNAFHSWGITRDNLPGFASQGGQSTGESSALEFEPGPASQHRHDTVRLDSQESQQPSTTSLLIGDLSSVSAASLDDPPLRPMVTVTQPPSERFGAVTQSPTDYETFCGLFPHSRYPVTRMGSSPSSPYQSKNVTLISDNGTFLVPPLQGSETPSSPSVVSSESPSPLSLSGLTLYSPRSSIVDVDEDFLARPVSGQERQGQGGTRWEKDGLFSEQPPISPGSSPRPDNGLESLISGAFISPPAPALEVAVFTEATNFGPMGANDINTTIPNPDLAGIPCFAPQFSLSFSIENFIPVMGGPSASNGAEPFSFPPGTPDDQPSGVSGLSTLSHLHSDPPIYYNPAGLSFSDRVNKSYERPLEDNIALGQGIGSSRPCSTARPPIADRNFNTSFSTRHNSASTRNINGWRPDNSRTREATREFHNRLLHMSITALEDRGYVPRASSLKDTLRYIIRDCFPGCHPTRQQIVDLLFGELPGDILMGGGESAVKKYYKDRVGHILSAPPNKAIFVNMNGGRWRLQEE